MEELRIKAEKIGITLKKEQLEQFDTYYHRLIEKNKVMNLTAITEYQEVIDKHFTDSLLLAGIRDLTGDISVIDVGTGGGFPGIPLKIAFPNLKITLLDSLNKRVGFLNEVIEELQLENITAIHSRAEDAGRNREYREQYDLCVSRAVANLAALSEYCLPFVKQSGYFISYKSVNIDEEIEQAGKAIKVLGGMLENPTTVQLPDTDIYRQFIMIQKVKRTPKEYPRKAGTAAKNPIL